MRVGGKAATVAGKSAAARVTNVRGLECAVLGKGPGTIATFRFDAVAFCDRIEPGARDAVAFCDQFSLSFVEVANCDLKAAVSSAVS